jgi:aminoglycoside phosphotransferase (APT) family kinase protein
MAYGKSLVPEVDGINVERVSAWLQANVDGALAPFRFQSITGGRSNLTFRVTGADGTILVLRRPPLRDLVPTAHDVAREYRILATVGMTTVPVPRVLGLCTDHAVSGASFYVMGWVDGVVLDSVEGAQELPGPT